MGAQGRGRPAGQGGDRREHDERCRRRAEQRAAEGVEHRRVVGEQRRLELALAAVLVTLATGWR